MALTILVATDGVEGLAGLDVVGFSEVGGEIANTMRDLGMKK
jgi:hypothetical protein